MLVSGVFDEVATVISQFHGEKDGIVLLFRRSGALTNSALDCSRHFGKLLLP